MIEPSFEWLGRSGRDDAGALAPQRIAHRKQAFLNYIEQNVAVFAVVLNLYRERVVEGEPRSLEAHAVPGEVPAAFSSSHS
jgi:hypothetical protein